MDINALNTTGDMYMNDFNYDSEGGIVMNPSQTLLNLDFNSFFGLTDATVPVEVSAELKAARESVANDIALGHIKKAKTAYSYIMLAHMIESVGGKQSILGRPMFELLVERAGFMTNAAFKKNHIEIYVNGLEYVFGKGCNEANVFKSVLIEQYLKGWSFVKTTEGKELHFQLPGSKDPVVASPIQDTKIKLGLRANGLSISLKKDDIIKPRVGKQFKLERSYTFTFGLNVINRNLVSVLKAVNIHDQKTVVVCPITLREELQYAEKAYGFRKEDAFAKLLVLKANNVDLTPIFEAVKEGKEKSIVLGRKEYNGTVKSLFRVSTPAVAFPAVYARTGVVSTTEALAGMVTPMVTLPRMVEFYKDSEGYDVVYTREAPNKTIGRINKNDNAKALWTVKTKFFVVDNATLHPNLNIATYAGNALFTDSWIESNGVCRVVSDMDHGGVKAATAPLSMLDKELAKGDINIIGASALKGGMMSVLGLVVRNPGTKEAGYPDYILNLLGLVGDKAPAMMSMIEKSWNDALSYMWINGEKVSGVYVEIDLKVTNAYTLDAFVQCSAEEDTSLEGQKATVAEYIRAITEEMDTEVKASKGIRAEVANAKAINPEFSVSEYVENGLTNGTIKRKPLWTKVIGQEIQSVAGWYGKDVAEEWLSALMDNQVELGLDISKKYALQHLGAIDIVPTSSYTVIELLDVLGEGIEKDSSSYSKEVGEKLSVIFGTNDSWIEVEYPNGSKVNVPTGNYLMNDLVKQLSDDSVNYVITKGLLNELLENFKNCFDSKGMAFKVSSADKYANALISKELLGKAFGYQALKGYYGVILPMLGNYGLTTAGITNRWRLTSKEDRDLHWTRMTLSKAPQYFKGATASYNVIELNFGKLNNMFDCAVFVNPEVVMMHQNDYDGDMMRITSGADVLPFVSQLADEWNGRFFSDFVKDEKAGNYLKAKAASKCTLEQYHQAVADAVLAKESVGKYTAQSYFYEAMTANLIGCEFKGVVTGKDIEVTEEMYYVLTSLTKMLIQVEAMNNMKSESGNGSSGFISDMLSNYTLANLKGWNGVTTEQVVKDHLSTTLRMLKGLVNTHDLRLGDTVRETMEVLGDVVQVMYFVACTFNPKAVPSMGIFSARNVNEKAFVEIAKGEEELAYDYHNCYKDIVNGIDQDSMYRSIIHKTLIAVYDVESKGDNQYIADYRF